MTIAEQKENQIQRMKLAIEGKLQRVLQESEVQKLREMYGKVSVSLNYFVAYFE